MSDPKKQIVTGNQTVKLFNEYYLESLDLTKLPKDSDERVIAEGALLLLLNYSLQNNVELKALNPVSIVSGIKKLIATNLDPNMPDSVYVVVYDGVVQFAPYKNGFIQLFQEYGMGVSRLVDIWEIRESDEFRMPRHVGVKMTDAEYQQNTSYGKVLKTVFVYLDEDGHTRYLMSERNNALPSLISAIQNANRQDPKVEEVINKIKEIDDIDKAVEYVKPLLNKWGKPYISPAWRVGTESMIQTKMRGYIARHQPTVKFKDAEKAQAYRDLINADYVDVTPQDTKINDQKLDEEVNNGAIGSQEVVEKEETTETTEKANTSDDFVEKDEVNNHLDQRGAYKELGAKQPEIIETPPTTPKKEEPPKDLFDGGNKADVKTDENGEVIEKTEQNVTETEKTDESNDEDDFAKFLQGE